MASFTGVGDTVTLNVAERDEQITVDLSGTYNMTILFQRLQGSKGSGSWETLKTYSTEDATVSETFTSKQPNETYRLIVDVDTSGTCTATLTEGVKDVYTQTDLAGNTLFNLTQEKLNLFVGLRKEVVSLTEATYALSSDEHAGRILLLDRSGGIDIDLPDATGSGDVYEFIVVTATADAYEISAFDVGDDDVFGVICGVDDEAEFTWGAGANNNTVTLGGTAQATGGSVGDYLRFVDIAAGKWSVQGFIHQGGTEATPFSTDS